MRKGIIFESGDYLFSFEKVIRRLQELNIIVTVIPDCLVKDFNKAYPSLQFVQNLGADYVVTWDDLWSDFWLYDKEQSDDAVSECVYLAMSLMGYPDKVMRIRNCIDIQGQKTDDKSVNFEIYFDVQSDCSKYFQMEYTLRNDRKMVLEGTEKLLKKIKEYFDLR